jgi:hypothetical protein
LIMPKDVTSKYNFEYLWIPKNSGVILISEKMGTFTLLSTRKKNTGGLKKTEVISPYYVRDNRLGEIYLGLKVIEALSPRTLKGKVNKKDLEEQIAKLVKNKGNTRNIFISLRGLGFVNEENRLTSEGERYVRMDYFEFCRNITFERLSPFFNVIMNALIMIANENKTDYSSIKTSAQEIREKILDIFNGNEVMYVTESKTRYISSWMNILKEDLGAVCFNTGNYQNIKINYFPSKGLPFLMREMRVSDECRDEKYVFSGLEKISKL